jgi:hypothetical protein
LLAKFEIASLAVPRQPWAGVTLGGTSQLKHGTKNKAAFRMFETPLQNSETPPLRPEPAYRIAEVLTVAITPGMPVLGYGLLL